MQKINKVIILILTLISITAIYYCYSHNLILIYNDARSHLNIARRVIDNLTPGLVQLGGTWLPLYHILMLPFIWNNFLFHSGISGSIISGLAYIAASYFIYKTIFHLTRSRIAVLVGLVVFALNPNLLYLQSVPMTETLLIFFVTSSLYYLLLWSEKDRKILYLVLSSGLIFFGTLIRYDAWFIILFELLFVAFVSFKKHGLKKAEGLVILFASLACLGIFLWILYNGVIWGKPFYFLNGEYSAATQQKIYYEQFNNLRTKFNIILSTKVYASAVGETVGYVYTVLAIISSIIFLFINFSKRIKLYFFIYFSPILFNIISLALGISVIFTHAFPSIGYYHVFNIRYGIMSLAFISISIALLTSKLIQTNKSLLIIPIIALLFQSYTFFVNGTPSVIYDGMYGKSSYRKDQEELASGIKNHYKGGLILISAGFNDPVMFSTGLSMKTFIYEGTGKYWKRSMTNPSEYADYVVISENDVIDKTLTSKKELKYKYHIIYQTQTSKMYQKNIY